MEQIIILTPLDSDTKSEYIRIFQSEPRITPEVCAFMVSAIPSIKGNWYAHLQGRGINLEHMLLIEVQCLAPRVIPVPALPRERSMSETCTIVVGVCAILGCISSYAGVVIAAIKP